MAVVIDAARRRRRRRRVAVALGAVALCAAAAIALAVVFTGGSQGRRSARTVTFGSGSATVEQTVYLSVRSLSGHVDRLLCAPPDAMGVSMSASGRVWVSAASGAVRRIWRVNDQPKCTH
jgi:hypothetical protein